MVRDDLASSRKIELFIACHKPGIRIPDNGLLRPIQVGCAFAKAPIPGLLHDDEGINISSKNRGYCELTAQYWAWKNRKADYYGFLHYRRYFNFSEEQYPIHHEPFIFGDVVMETNDDATLSKIGFTEERMRYVIESHDFIAPEPIAAPNGKTVYEQYCESVGHKGSDLDLVLRIIEKEYPEIWPSAQRYVNQTSSFVCNMFVMRRELFFDYSAFLFNVLEMFDSWSDRSHYTAIGRRVEGYLAERICGMYIAYLFDSGYDGVKLQRVYFRRPESPSAKEPENDNDEGAATSNGRLSFGPVTRGSGRIYFKVLGVADAGETTFAIESLTEGGEKVPAKVLSLGATPVAVLPILAVDQLVTVEAFDAAGRMVARVSQKCGAAHAKYRSRINTLLKNDEAISIRDIDKDFLPDDVRVTPLRIISDVDATELLQGCVTYLLKREADPSLIEVDVLDGNGRNITIGDWVCLKDEMLPVDDCDAFVRKVSYSVRVPCGNAYVVWARFPDDARVNGFDVMSVDTIDRMRREWREATTPACESGAYNEWFTRVHRAKPAELALQRSSGFGYRPLFSLIVPLYRTPQGFFVEMVESVLSQTYANWELVLVNASPEDDGLASLVARYCSNDARIKEVRLEENRGITLNTNEGIKRSSGEFLAFLDHDDVLEPDALFRYVSAINASTSIDLLYCDEDKVSGGRYYNPFFKPGWDPYLLLSENYVCHFLAVRASIVRGLDVPGAEFDGSQDWHMTWRVAELARGIHHEPRVLYHWRAHDGSTAKSASQKDYTLKSSQLVVERHLSRCAIRGSVDESPVAPRRFVVNYARESNPLVSIVVPGGNDVTALCRCLVSILSHTAYRPFEVVVVECGGDNDAMSAFCGWVQGRYDNVRAVSFTEAASPSDNRAMLYNFGASCANGEYLLLLDGRTEAFGDSWLGQLLGLGAQEDVGAVGAKLLLPDGTIEHVGIALGQDGPCRLSHRRARLDPGNFESTLLTHEVPAVSGECMLLEAALFEELGGIDSSFATDLGDVDLCLRIKEKGLRNIICPTAELRCHTTISPAGPTDDELVLRRKDKGEFMKRWAAYFERGGLPSNPNLMSTGGYEALQVTPWRMPWM